MSKYAKPNAKFGDTKFIWWVRRQCEWWYYAQEESWTRLTGTPETGQEAESEVLN